jgi:hypothetical protein
LIRFNYIEQELKLTPPSKEQEKPLTLTLSKKAQEGVLGSLMYGLETFTYDEVLGRYRNNPEIVEQVDEARKVTTAIAKNLGEEIDEVSALTMGLIEFIPREQLQKWAQSKIPGEITLKQRAQYFLTKESREQVPQKP